MANNDTPDKKPGQDQDPGSLIQPEQTQPDSPTADDLERWVPPGGEPQRSSDTDQSDQGLTANDSPPGADSSTPKSSNPSADQLENRAAGAGGLHNAKQSVASTLRGIPNVISIARKQRGKIIGGSVVGLIGASLFGAGLFLQGPLQFIHMSQLLSQFHLDEVDSFSDERGSKLWRRAANPGFDPDSVRARRLSALGNKFADATELRANRNGIRSEYNRAGNFDGYTFDPDLYQGGRYAGDPAGMRDHLRQQGFDANLQPNGTVRAPNQSGTLKNRRLITLVSTEAGYNKILGKLASRTLRTRGAVTFHPIKRLNQWGRLSSLEFWDALRGVVIRGDTGVDPRVRDYNSEEDLERSGSDDPDVRDTADPPSDVDIDEAELERVRNTSGSLADKAKIGGGIATTIAAGTCIVYGISQNYDEIGYENVNLPLMRFGMWFVAAGSQFQSNDDLEADAVKHVAPNLTDESGASWPGAASIQAELGQNPTGPDVPDAIRPPGGQNAVFSFIDRIPIVSDVCKVIGSPGGQLAGLALDVVAGPLSLFISGMDLAFDFSGKFISFLTNWLARDPVDIENYKGPTLGGAANIGVRLAASEAFNGMGARELTPVETGALDSLRNQERISTRSQLSFFDRLFNVEDANSFTTQLAFALPYGTGSSTTNINSAQSVFARLINLPFTVPRALAQDGSVDYDYGFNEYGFSERERNDPRFDDPYENADIIFDKLPELNDTYGPNGLKCFGVDVQSDGTIVQLGRSSSGINPTCNGEGLTAEEQEDLLRYRFYIADMVVATSGACLEGDTSACSDLGYGTTAPSSTSGAASPIAGLSSPSNLGEPDSNGYYQMPEADGGQYQLNTNGGSPPNQQCGSKVLVDVTYTILAKYYSEYGERLGVGDLNAVGHSSHDKGTDVDIYGSTYVSRTTPMADNDRAIQLGVWAYQTGQVQLIFYSVAEVRNEVNKQVGDPNFMIDSPGHTDHFHIRLLPELEGPESTSCSF